VLPQEHVERDRPALPPARSGPGGSPECRRPARRRRRPRPSGRRGARVGGRAGGGIGALRRSVVVRVWPCRYLLGGGSSESSEWTGSGRGARSRSRSRPVIDTDDDTRIRRRDARAPAPQRGMIPAARRPERLGAASGHQFPRPGGRPHPAPSPRPSPPAWCAAPATPRRGSHPAWAGDQACQLTARCRAARR
jgi:hypothetical protein